MVRESVIFFREASFSSTRFMVLDAVGEGGDSSKETLKRFPARFEAEQSFIISAQW
jgi:hypothetical protein